MKKLEVRWIVIDGSIFTEKEIATVVTPTSKIKVRESIAFNVGDEVAKRIVDLHNIHLET